MKNKDENLQDLDRFEVENKFFQLLSFGDEKHIAEHMPQELGNSASIISQYLNPGNERISPIYRALCLIVAMLKFDQRKGTQALKLFMHFAGRYVTGWVNDSSAVLRKGLVSAWEAFIAGELEQRTPELQVRALEEVVLWAQRLLSSKRRELLRRPSNVKELRAVGK